VENYFSTEFMYEMDIGEYLIHGMRLQPYVVRDGRYFSILRGKNRESIIYTVAFYGNLYAYTTRDAEDAVTKLLFGRGSVLNNNIFVRDELVYGRRPADVYDTKRWGYGKDGPPTTVQKQIILHTPRKDRINKDLDNRHVALYEPSVSWHTV